MALKSSLQWVFFNEANADEKIVVLDQKSAQTLAQVLNEHQAVWVMKEEAREGTTSISAPVLTPVAQAKAPVELESPNMPEFHVEAPIEQIAQPEPEPMGASAIGPRPQTPPSMPAPPPRAMKPEDRRAQKRFKVGLRIILISKNKSFRSISQDVSLGGMRLKNRVPTDFLGGKCIAYLSNLDSKENIEMVCQVISDPKDPCRIQFSEPDSQQLKRLNKWLVENEPSKKAG